VRRLLVLVVLVVLVALTAPARAEFVMCIGGQGATPPDGSIVPPRAHLAFYSDRNLRLPGKVTATLGGKPVKVTTSSKQSSPFNLLTVVIDSDQTGDLVVLYENHGALHYRVRPLELPKEVTGLATRYASDRSGARGEEFNGLAIRLPEDTPAVFAHVRLRPSESALWLDLDVALYTPPESRRPMIRAGQFACESNADLAALARGFDLDVTVTLADGTKRMVTGLAKHMTLPAPLPPQPRPKNQRAR
jgi:hypothetical protein